MAKREDFKLSISERRRLSENFKKEKVLEIERGLNTVSDISKQYEVTRKNVYQWLTKYGSQPKSNWLIVKTQSDTKELLSLKKRIAELERIIGQKQILIDFKDKMIELAEDTYQVDIKKKNLYLAVQYYWLNREQNDFSMNALYDSLSISIQSFHQYISRNMKFESQ